MNKVSSSVHQDPSILHLKHNSVQRKGKRGGKAVLAVVPHKTDKGVLAFETINVVHAVSFGNTLPLDVSLCLCLTGV